MLKLAQTLRGDFIESENFGFITLLDSKGKAASKYPAEYSTYIRSILKPIQASVAKELLGDDLKDDFFCLAMSSHSAQPNQIISLKKMAEHFKLNVNQLHCGLCHNKKNFLSSKLEHNCSGKHLALMAAAIKNNLGKEYYSYDHAIQRMIREKIKKYLEKKNYQFNSGIDGCGLPTYHMSMHDTATLLQNFTKDSANLEQIKVANHYHELIAAPGKLDTNLMKNFPNKFFAKGGAAGITSIVNLETHETLIVKVIDGNDKIKNLVAEKALQQLKWINIELGFDYNIYNSRNEVVGEIQIVI